MNLFDALLASPAIQISGWALLHSLWQGVVLAICLKGALSLLRKASANSRYLLACLTLSLLLILPVSTALLSSPGKQTADFSKGGYQNEKTATLPATSLRNGVSENESSYSLWMYQAERNLLPWLVFIWLTGVFISSLRLLGVWTFTQRLKRNGKQPVLDQSRESLERLCRQLRISKPVILFESSLVKVPTVIGWLKPVILIPSCALTGLTPQQFELILAHELAHIRRNDYLINLFQTVIETFLFYHPAAWWVSNQIRNERENACDDLAVEMSGDAPAYARTLVAMERLRKSNPTLAMAADGGSLTQRIHRLIGVEMPHSKPFAGVWVVIFISIFLVSFGVTKQNSFSIKKQSSEELSNFSPLANPESNKELFQDSQAQNVKAVEKSQNLTEEDKKKSEESPDPDLKIDELNNLQVDSELQQEDQSGSQEKSGDFIEEMASVGYTNLTVSQLVRLKEGDVTAEYVKGLNAVGLTHLTVEELWRLGINEITPAYIQAIRNAGYTRLRAKDFALLAEHGVTTADINKLRSAGYNNLSVWQIIELADSDLNVKRVPKSKDRDTVEDTDEPDAPPFLPAPSLGTPMSFPVREERDSG